MFVLGFNCEQFIDIRSTLLHDCYQEAHADVRMLRRHMVIVVISLSDKRRRRECQGRNATFDSKDSRPNASLKFHHHLHHPPTLNIQRSKVRQSRLARPPRPMRPPPPSIQWHNLFTTCITWRNDLFLCGTSGYVFERTRYRECLSSKGIFRLRTPGFSFASDQPPTSQKSDFRWFRRGGDMLTN